MAFRWRLEHTFNRRPFHSHQCLTSNMDSVCKLECATPQVAKGSRYREALKQFVIYGRRDSWVSALIGNFSRHLDPCLHPYTTTHWPIEQHPGRGWLERTDLALGLAFIYATTRPDCNNVWLSCHFLLFKPKQKKKKKGGGVLYANQDYLDVCYPMMKMKRTGFKDESRGVL